MRRTLKNLLRLSPLDWARLARAGALVAAADMALRCFSFASVQGFMASAARGRRSRSMGALERERLAWFVGVAGRKLGPMGTCLRQALALQWLLGRRGEPSTLWLGADRRSDSFAAHAWLEDAGGRVLIGGPIDKERFAALQSFEAPPRISPPSDALPASAPALPSS